METSQKEFTDLIILGLRDGLPNLTFNCKIDSDSVASIILKSGHGNLELWVTTENKEITIGFSADHELNDWHTHASLFGAKTPEEELEVAIELIESIITDKEPIIFSSILGYFITDDHSDIEKYKQPNEIIEQKLWSEL